MSHYFENNDAILSEERITKTIINNIPFTFKTDNNVFSKKGLDFGTKILIESLPNINGSVLDMGCGYGPIGIYLAKIGLDVDMCDINKRALKLACDNIKINNVSANVFESNIYENVDKKYDYIISNPPIRVGNVVLYQMLFEAKDHLNKNGHLIIVVNKDQGAKTLAKRLEKEYKVEILNKNKGFFVIDCKI